MPKVQIATLEQADREDAPAGSTGTIDARVYFKRACDALHMHHYQLGTGAVLKLDREVIDRIAYVWRGAVMAGHIPLAQGSSVIVERGAEMELAACAQDTILLLFGASETRNGARAGGNIHLLPSDHVPRADRLEGEDGLGGALHSDATCATCQVWLHEMVYRIGDYLVPVHSHSEDEIIFVSEGDIRLGNRLYGAGTAVRIAAHTKYGFRAGPHGMRFINFRDSPPTFTTAGDAAKEMDESLYWRATVGTPPYVNPMSQIPTGPGLDQSDKARF